MKGENRHNFFIALILVCLLTILPLTVYGADFTIGTGVAANGDWILNGGMTATSFSGNGSGLSDVIAAGLNCSGCVSQSELDFSPGTITGVTAGTGLSGGGTSGNVTLNVNYGGVAIVARSGGDYADPVTAMNNVGSWCPFRGPEYPCLLKIMPGVYDIGTNTIQMQEYVDIEGSGEDTTMITGNPDGCTISGASNAEIRFLTARNTGTGTLAIAIQAVNGASSRITHVTAIASGGENNIGISAYSASPVLTEVTARAELSGTFNHGVLNDNGSATVMRNVTASASGGASNNGVYNTNGSSVEMRNVTATASGGSVSNGVFNEYSDVLMENVDASASDGETNNGVMNMNSSPTMDHVTAKASGGTDSNGVLNQDSGTFSMFYVQANASGASDSSTGIRNQNSTVRVHFCSAVAKDSAASVNNGMLNDGSSVSVYSSVIIGRGEDCTSGCFAVHNTTSGTVNVDNSRVIGVTNTIYNESGVTTYVGNSQLYIAPVFNGGTLKCIGTYDSNYDQLDNTCQTISP